MTVVFDEERALDDVKLYHKKEQNRKILATVFITIALIGFGFFGSSLIDLHAIDWLEYVGAALMFVSVTALLVLGQEDLKPEPSVAARYHIATEGKKVLDVRVETRPGAWTTYESVRLLTEISAGAVENIELCAAKYQENTTVSEAVFDVNAGVIYTPYKHEECEE